MACGATLSLKRSLEFDPLHSPGQHSPKRRRCMPMTMSSTAPPTKSHHTNPSPFSDVVPKISSEQIAAQIGAEIKRMQKRKQLSYGACSSSSPPSPSSHMDSPESVDKASAGAPSVPSPNRKEVPLFTFKQVNLVCERMLKEREEQIRSEYDKVLSCKLAEQYEAFLKFNHDQLHRRFNESAASYVS